MLPYLSLIIPVRNERKMLPGLIDELLEQNYPPELYEIIVVDGRSTDGTADLVRRRYSGGTQCGDSSIGGRRADLSIRALHDSNQGAAGGYSGDS